VSVPMIGTKWRRVADGVLVTVVGRGMHRGVREVFWRAENNNRGATVLPVFEANYTAVFPASSTGSDQP